MTSARLIVCLKNTFALYSISCFRCILWLNDIRSKAKVSEQTNRNLPARNTLVHRLALYTNPENHNAQRHRRTDRQQAYANSRSYCVAVRSAKKGDTIFLSMSLLNIDRFSQFFHQHTQLEIWNKIINNPTSPQMCCYTTL